MQLVFIFLLLLVTRLSNLVMVTGRWPFWLPDPNSKTFKEACVVEGNPIGTELTYHLLPSLMLSCLRFQFNETKTLLDCVQSSAPGFVSSSKLSSDNDLWALHLGNAILDPTDPKWWFLDNFDSDQDVKHLQNLEVDPMKTVKKKSPKDIERSNREEQTTRFQRRVYLGLTRGQFTCWNIAGLDYQELKKQEKQMGMSKRSEPLSPNVNVQDWRSQSQVTTWSLGFCMTNTLDDKAKYMGRDKENPDILLYKYRHWIWKARHHEKPGLLSRISKRLRGKQSS
ncbi:hypothetical protein AMATHDRAFT_51442 [Amanita thiersii Skay4041]|uniref:Uncharacterized protein n=1 Tax=Amanita thiersii Skay4041 TaxID=703135 RepID=A0A2A9NDN3_9AGAR|nr:hypothetical protein AMATHDRAFT_51442 [Amanita thiersii Skay4041]